MQAMLISHPDIWLHDLAADHAAMNKFRISRVESAIKTIPGVVQINAEEATDEQILRNHSESYFATLCYKSPVSADGYYKVAPDTVMNSHTLRALRLSAGAACQGVDAILDEQASKVFVAGYAGHHAGNNYASGFCFLNSIAISAHHAIARGVNKIAILDFDVHSGDGTILSFLDHSRVVFAETYQPGFPGSFLPGYCPSNIIRKRIKTRRDFLNAWDVMIPELSTYQPELVLVSAGFDAHTSDPLGTVGLVDDDYRYMASNIKNVSEKVMAFLEGGYSFDATPRCAEIFMRELIK